jgi:uncharacterized protein
VITRRQLLTFLAGGALSVAALGGYAFGYEPLLRLRTTHYAFTPRRWRPGLKLRIVALSDIHACEPWMSAARIRSICETANGLDPDVIVLLGDYVSSMRYVTRHLRPEEWAAAMSSLKAPLGVHAILGNHDWWADLEAQARGGGPCFAQQALRDVGFEVYSNEARRLEKDGHGFWLAGLEDQLALRPGLQWNRLAMRGLHNLPHTLNKVTDSEPIILLAHEPDIFPRVPARVSLTLSGHTHGGQVRVLGYAPIVPSEYGTRYVYGHVNEQGRDIIISGGLGCSGLPVRFGSPPEITVIDLG